MLPWNATNTGEFLWIAALVFLGLVAYAVLKWFGKSRRRKSLRREGGLYVWLELDGSEKRSTDDPRPAWDAEDAADGDGDGGGGGGD